MIGQMRVKRDRFRHRRTRLQDLLEAVAVQQIVKLIPIAHRTYHLVGLIDVCRAGACGGGKRRWIV